MNKEIIYNLIARLNESTRSPSESEALRAYLEEMKKTKGIYFAMHTVDDVLERVFVMHEAQHQFFIRYNQNFGMDSTHNVNR